ncbi:MAG: DUF1330 domain-containing protein [Gammaproteobacteria bacterium]|nr:DUF1330 domain-containing protein [Gammaproteobacteria bacterium]
MQTVTLNEPEITQAFDALPDDGKPVSMLNLLRYRERAEYVGHPEQPPCSGREAYTRYAELAFPIVSAVGARPIFIGTCIAHVVAPPSERWDDLLLVEYPTRRAFVDALTSKEYRAISFHRTAALQDSRLIAFRGGAVSFRMPGGF